MIWPRTTALAAVTVAALAAAVLLPHPAAAEDPATRAGSPDAALAQLLDATRADNAIACPEASRDSLVRVLCTGLLRVGVRNNYPNFGVLRDDAWHGYEVDLARAIATRLGVDVAFQTATPVNRLALLAEGRIDVAIATIGHNTQRDGQATFVRPHYYQSETVLVGPRVIPVTGWPDLASRTVCVTVGNGSNAELSSHDARLMLFDGPGQLLDGLTEGTCPLVAQDNSFFAASFAQPGFAKLYDSKFAFAPVPWGMAVARDGGSGLARALGLLTQIFHRDGVLLEIAAANHVATGFLAAQQEVWRRPDCDTATGGNDPGCILPPLNAVLQPTGFAGQVADVEAWLATNAGLRLSLPMLKTVPAWSLLQSGVINSVILVSSTLAATLLMALSFGGLLAARARWLRWPARTLVVVLQSTPPIMCLAIAAAIANEVGRYTTAASLIAATVALGLINGANAGQAISEAVVTLRAEARVGLGAGTALFVHALQRAARQIEAFLVNATKSTPIASFIGTPELLNALTDISSFSSERLTTYWLILVFYIAVVMGVVRLCAVFRAWLNHQGARAARVRT